MVKVCLILGSLFAFVANCMEMEIEPPTYTQVQKMEYTRGIDTIKQYGAEFLKQVIATRSVKLSKGKLPSNKIINEYLEKSISVIGNVELPYSVVKKLIEKHQMYNEELSDELLRLKGTKKWLEENKNITTVTPWAVRHVLERHGSSSVKELDNILTEQIPAEIKKNHDCITYLFKSSKHVTKNIYNKMQDRLLTYCGEKKDLVFAKIQKRSDFKDMMEEAIDFLMNDLCIREVDMQNVDRQENQCITQ